MSCVNFAKKAGGCFLSILRLFYFPLNYRFIFDKTIPISLIDSLLRFLISRSSPRGVWSRSETVLRPLRTKALYVRVEKPKCSMLSNPSERCQTVCKVLCSFSSWFFYCLCMFVFASITAITTSYSCDLLFFFNDFDTNIRFIMKKMSHTCYITPVVVCNNPTFQCIQNHLTHRSMII